MLSAQESPFSTIAPVRDGGDKQHVHTRYKTLTAALLSHVLSMHLCVHE